MKRIYGLIPATILFLASCGGGEAEETNDTDTSSVAQETCTYSYDEESTILTWTAFKLTDKIGVNGTFDQINVVATSSEDMFGVLTNATFDIPVSSLNSQDDVRDPKIKNSFFGNMTETSLIAGTVNSIDNTTANISIVMNGVTKDYNGNVTVDGETITVKLTIDILDFDGQTAIDSLGVVCEEKHTGEDGVNKLWSDVEIAVKTTLIKECK